MSTHARQEPTRSDNDESGPPHASSRASKTTDTKWWAGIVAALVVGIVGGLVAGIQIGKGSPSTTANESMMNGGQQMGGGFGMRGGTRGSVTAVTDTSITVEDSRQNTTVTYTITDSTTITDGGETANISDIAVGDSVMIQSDGDTLSSDDAATKTATSIARNPTMPSGGPGTSSSTN